MILMIGDRHYELVDAAQLRSKLTFAQQVFLQRELVVTGISSARSFADVVRLAADFYQLPAGERDEHPEGQFLLAVVIWASRVCAGESIGLLEAIDVPISDIRFIPEPDDGAEPEGKAGAGKGPATRRAPGGRSKKRRS